MTSHIHQSHPDIINRLSRARGHLQIVTRMVEDGRSCLDIAQQLHAVEKAIQQVKRTLVQDHVARTHAKRGKEGTIDTLNTGNLVTLADDRQPDMAGNSATTFAKFDAGHGAVWVNGNSRYIANQAAGSEDC